MCSVKRTYIWLLGAGDFAIGRLVSATCDVADPTLPDISATSTYTPRLKGTLNPGSDFIPGEKLKKPAIVMSRPPGQHPVPKGQHALSIHTPLATFQAGHPCCLWLSG
eukprot:jgi/Chrzof1/11101/Cz05g23200.t1